MGNGRCAEMYYLATRLVVAFSYHCPAAHHAEIHELGSRGAGPIDHSRSSYPSIAWKKSVALVELVDVTVTLAELAGIAPPSNEDKLDGLVRTRPTSVAGR